MISKKFLANLLIAAIVLLMSCKEEISPSISPVPPTKMKIVGITLDSAFQISNPMSFVVQLKSSTNAFQTNSYNLPFSNQAWYPSALWQGLDESFDVTSQITMSVFFQLPGSMQLYPEGNNSVFNFRPENKTGTTINNSPSTISFINPLPGGVSTKITLSVIWQ